MRTSRGSGKNTILTVWYARRAKRYARSGVSERRALLDISFRCKAQSTQSQDGDFLSVGGWVIIRVSIPSWLREKSILLLVWLGWYEEFRKTIGEAAQLIKGSGQPVPTTAGPRSGEVFFTKNAQAKLKQWGVSETDCLDVSHHGSVAKQHMIVRT